VTQGSAACRHPHFIAQNSYAFLWLNTSDILLKAKFYYAILLANQLASWLTSMSLQPASELHGRRPAIELEFGISRTI